MTGSTNKGLRHFLLVVLTVVLTAFLSTAALSQTDVPVPDYDDTQELSDTLHSDAIFKKWHDQDKNRIHNCLNKSPDSAVISDDNWKKKYSSRFNFCMRMILEEAAQRVLEEVKDYMEVAMYAIILLATIIMGTKAIGGMFRNVKAEVTLFVGKVIAVIMVFGVMDQIPGVLFGIADWILTMLGDGARATFVPQGPAFQCNGMVAANFPQYQWISVFDWMDCLIGKLFGVGTSKEALLGFTSIAGASFFAGTGGVQLGMMFISFFIGLGLFLLRVTTMLIMAYGLMAMLTMMLPIFLLTVFFKVTESYFFQRWLTLVVRNIVQPAIVIGFLYFALAAVDRIVYKGSENTHFTYSVTPVSADPATGVEVNTTVVSGSSPPAGYKQVIEPIHSIFEIDPAAHIDVQIKKIRELIVMEKIGKDFKLNADNAVFHYVDSKCGEFGIAKAAVGLAKDTVMASWSRIEQLLAKITPDSPEVGEKLKDGLDAPPGSELHRKATEFLCAVGSRARWALKNDFIRGWVEKKIKSALPSVPKLDLGILAKGTNLDPNDVHDAKIAAANLAVVAILILAGTFFVYTSHIEKLAATIVSRMGMGLSIANPDTPGGFSISTIARGGLTAVQNGWTNMVKNKPALEGAKRLLGKRL